MSIRQRNKDNSQDSDMHPSDKMPLMNDKKVEKSESNWFLLVCFAGIFFSYLIFGILLEKITRGKYGEDGDKFTYNQVLIFIMVCVNCIWAKCALIIKRGSARDFSRDHTPNWLYACTAASYVGAMLSSTNALKYVPYPTQVIGKSCKPIAVMLLGVLWAGKRYTWKKVGCICLVVIGVALFMYNPDKASASDSDHSMGWGEVLLVISLLMDGFTGAFQEKMRTDQYRTTEHNMMYNMNFWSVVILSTGIIYTGEYASFWEFTKQYPQVWSMIFLYSMCAAVGQHFIFLTVVTFGPLMCSVITTTRKFFTVLCSVILFRNPMSMQKWFATLLVFIGLSLDIVYGKKRAAVKKN